MKTLNPVFLSLAKRLINNKGLNVVICGEPGGGKSRRGLRVCEIFDINGFSREKIVYNAEAFITFLNTKSKKGDAVMWDENIGSEATSWYTDTNKAVKRSMNIMRKKGIAFVQCLPSLLDLQSGCRRLFHVYIEPMDFFPVDDGYLCKVMQMQHNPQNKITYFKYFRIKDPSNKKKRIRVNRIFIRTPHNNELTERYEEDSDKEKNIIHDENIDIIKKERERKQTNWRATLDIDEHVTTVLGNINAFCKVIGKGRGRKRKIDTYRIRNMCKVGGPTASRIKAEVESRGFSSKIDG